MCIITYNCLVRAKNDVKESFSSIDVHLKLRFDLIPNLVNVVKAYCKHEKETLTQITQIRVDSMQNISSEERIKLANKAVPLMNKLFMIAENNPVLKASDVFRKLQDEIVDVEDKIAAARRFYNSAVKRYNNRVQVFPSSIVAKMFKFKKEPLFEIVENQKNISEINI